MTAFTVVPAWAWITLSTLFFAAGEFLSKKFALNPGWTVFALIIVVDILSITAWLPAIFEKNHLSTTGVIWSIVSLMMTALVGFLIFGEKLTSVQIIGIFLGVVSVALLSI
ncbi:MAG TPA: hypothetical protein VFT82_02515 [Candidatus Paceibacterota bacterium]|nr:hypothetical protein [Candidatus Paceibacterota bacterium]